QKTYNTKDSLVVTDPTTSLALTGLSMGERTGSRILRWVWSYVVDSAPKEAHIVERWGLRRRIVSLLGSGSTTEGFVQIMNDNM
ncbi:uncharacterized protein LY79DRAFT_524902, partial [Colletotrichum navitas]